MIVVDTGVLYSYFVADDPEHALASALFNTVDEVFVVSPLVLAEIDYFVLKRFGIRGEQAMLEELLDGAYELPALTWEDIRSCRAIISSYPDKALGLADASLIVLADRFMTPRIATFDRRHFGTTLGMDGNSLELLP